MAFLTEDVVRKIGRKALADMRRERLHRALDAVMDRAGDAYGKPTGMLQLSKAADGSSSPTEETRTYEIKAPREVLNRFEAFLSHVQYCGGVGHSTIIGMPIDGDGAEYFNVESPKLPDIEHELSDKEQRVEVPRR